MTPIIASLCSCVLRKPLLSARNKISGKFTFVLLGVFVSVPAFAGGADISADEVYSDDITVTTFDGEPLDINGDGNVDLALAVNEGIETSRYYPGNGDGTFGDPIFLAINPSSEIVAADFNGDMFIDLLQGVRDNPSRLYLGDGAGNLGSPLSVLDTDRVLAVAVGDLDKDGDLDLVTGTGHPGGEPSTPDNLAPNRYYLNNIIGTGEMSFAGADIGADMDDTRAIALADMDGDGDLDVIAGNDETTPGSNRVYLNQLMESGTNTVSFGPGIDFGPEDDQTSRILVGHLNDDDRPDIVVLNFIASAGTAGVGSPGINRFFINETEASGAFTLSAATDISADADMSSGGALADFDGDGDLDIAVANIVNGPGEPRNRLYLNQFLENGAGTVTFAAGMDISADEHQSRELAAGDINGDGHIDIVVANQPLPGNVDPVPGRDRRYLNNGNPEAPFTNVAPVIDSQAVALETAVDASLTIEPEHLTVTDPDNVYPGDFTLAVQSGMNYTVDPATNTITPAAGFSGNLAVPVTVNDGTDASAAFELCVDVGGAGACNDPPEFTSTPVTDATAGTVYTYGITVTDADGDALTITAPALPAWLTLTDNEDGTATLTGTPADGDVGNHDVSLQASDGSAAVTQPFSIAVAAGTGGGENEAPEFTSTAVTGATEDEEYRYEITASDADGDDITITAPTLPGWLTLTDNGDGTATLSGTPGAADVGEHDVSLQASDGTASVTQDFTVTVEAAASGGGGGGNDGDNGGGGSFGGWSLLALLGVIAARRRRRIA